jgi:rubrerythrin
MNNIERCVGMGVQFSTDEIFEMAEQLERNGAKFYRKAADGIDDKEESNILLDLAFMEDEHEKTFADMRKDLSGAEAEATAFDPQGEAALYLQAFADGHVFDPDADPSEKLTGEETIEGILRMAIGLEKDSIVFYLGIRDAVKAQRGKNKIDELIKEEMSHVSGLSKQLSSL